MLKGLQRRYTLEQIEAQEARTLHGGGGTFPVRLDWERFTHPIAVSNHYEQRIAVYTDTLRLIHTRRVAHRRRHNAIGMIVRVSHKCGSR